MSSRVGGAVETDIDASMTRSVISDVQHPAALPPLDKDWYLDRRSSFLVATLAAQALTACSRHPHDTHVSIGVQAFRHVGRVVEEVVSLSRLGDRSSTAGLGETMDRGAVKAAGPRHSTRSKGIPIGDLE